MRFPLLICIICSMTIACNQHSKSAVDEAAVKSTDSMMVRTDTTKVKYTTAMVDNRKDPNCGMPVTAGIEDTVHYKGKVYGFCSEECKAAFLKNPVELAKNADLKP